VLLEPWCHWPLAHIDMHTAMSALTLSSTAAGGDEPRWHRPGVRRYLQLVCDFRRQLLLLIHLMAGLPVSARTLLAVRQCNTQQLRHLFVCKGYMMLLLPEQKQPRLRFLPTVVGEQLLKFIGLAQLLVQILRHQLLSDNTPADYPTLHSSSHAQHCDTDYNDYDIDSTSNIDVPSTAMCTDENAQSVLHDKDDDEQNNDIEDKPYDMDKNDNNSVDELPHDSFIFSDDGREPWLPSKLLLTLHLLTEPLLGFALLPPS
jgi:hypothetical protein